MSLASCGGLSAPTAKASYEALRPMPCSIVSGLAAGLRRSHAELVAENVLLRQQLIVAARKVKRPILNRHERTLITLLAAVCANDSLAVSAESASIT